MDDYEVLNWMAFLAIGIAVLGCIGVPWIGSSLRAWRERREVIPYSQINDCKPGCFEQRKQPKDSE